MRFGRGRLVLLAAFAGAMLGTRPARAGAEELRGGGCGEQAVAVVLESLGLSAPSERIRALVASDASGTSSFEDLRRALAAVGVDAAPCRFGVEVPAGSVIAYRPPQAADHAGHFVALLPGDDGSVWEAADPPVFRIRRWNDVREEYYTLGLRCTRVVTSPALVLALIGIAMTGLILAWRFRRRLVSAIRATVALAVLGACQGCGPQTSLEPVVGLRVVGGAEVDLGVVDLKSHHSLTLENLSTNPVTIERVTSSCGCAVAVVSDAEKVVQSGARARLSCDLSVGAGETRRLAITVFVSMGAPVQILLRATGRSTSWKFTSPRVHVGRAYVGSSAAVPLQVVTPQEEIGFPSDPGTGDWIVLDSREVRIDSVSRAEGSLTGNLVIVPTEVGHGLATVQCAVGGRTLKAQVDWDAVSPLGVSSHVLVLKEGSEGIGVEVQVLPPEGVTLGSCAAVTPGLDVHFGARGREKTLVVKATDAWKVGQYGEAWVDVLVAGATVPFRTPVRLVSDLRR